MRDRLDQADRYLKYGLTDSALASFGMAIENNDRVTKAWMGMGEIYRQRDDYRKAARRYERVTELEPNNARARYYFGRMQQMLGDVQESVEAYLQTLTLSPEDGPANRALAAAYLQLDQPGQALPYAEAATELQPEQQQAWATLASAYSRTDRYEHAVDAYRRALDAGEPTGSLLLGLSKAHLALDNRGRAVNTLKSLIRRSPSTEAHERLGYAYFKARRFEQALAQFNSALDYDANNTAALNGKGVSLMTLFIEGGRENTSQRRRALQAWRKSLTIDSNQPRIVDYLSKYSRS